MDAPTPLPRLLILSGIVLIVAGVLVWALQGRLHWFGRLPGDIRVERENFRFYAPLATMLIISLLLTLIVNLVRRFFQ